MNNDNDVWYMRNDLTTYYVPNSLLNKSVTRTITIKEPGQADRTITQTAKLSRQVKVNGDDTGVTFEGFDDSGWKADSNWGVQDVPIHAGYNISVTQTVEGASTSTPLQLVNGQIPAETVNGDTKNTQIVVTYGATATAAATLGKEGSRDYDAKTTSVADVLSKLGWTDSGFVKNQTLKSTDLTASDYAWFTKNADGTFTAMTGDPINAGTYYLKLKDSSEAKLKAENPNYNLTINGEFTYTINPVSGTATLSGSASKIYDGKDISLDDLNSPDGDIEVKFTFPGSTVADTYKLHAGDYTIENNSAKADDYTVSLSTDGLARLQAAIDNYAGAGNVTLAAKDLSSNASFTIKQKDLTVTLDKKPNTTPGKTYDGQTATIDDNDAQFTAAGLVEGQTLNVANLTPSDYEWVDKDGKKLDKVPTDAGTYYIALTQAGVNQLQKDNPNYKVSESGQFAYVIAKAEAKVEINGSYEGTSTEINPDDFLPTLTLGNNPGTKVNGLTSSDYQFVDDQSNPISVPTESGHYHVALTPQIIQKLQKDNPNYKIPGSNIAPFTLDATLTIVFQDTDENNKQVGDAITKIGVDGSTIDNLGLNIPAGYELAKDETLPSDYTFGKDLKQSVFVKLAHIKKTVEHTDPIPEDSKTPTGKPINGAHENDLNKTITRTINVTDPSGKKTSTAQDAKIYRNAVVDEVTGKVTYGAWSTGNWGPFTTPTIDGYTPTIASIATKPVTYGTDPESVDITYTPNAQTTNIIYKDEDGQTIKTDKVDGKTNETVKVDSTIPVGWKLLDGHKPAPKTVKFGPEGHPDIVIEIEHNITKVPHDNPVPENGKTPTDKPIDGAHEDDLNQTITRTINVKNPDGTTDTTTQTAKIYRDASYDDVTGEVTYGDWSTATWDAFNTPTIKDYTPSQAEVPAVIVQDGQKDEVVNITYVPVPKPEQGEQVIHYVDGDDGDKVISTQVVKGKDGEDVSFTPNIPNNFVPATDIPSTVKISGSTTTITLKHKTTDASQTKIITRTITENFPSGATKTETQSATLTETGTKDLVTGEIKWHNDWTTGEWQKFTPATVPGYTPSEAEVPAVEVKVGQKDVTITINYSPTEQTGKISYQDKDGNEIGTTPLTGKTDETIPVDPNKDVPAGWKIIPDQKIPETVKVTPDGVPTVVVKIEHKTITVTPETPEEEIPMGKVPGDPSKTYPAMESITKTPTRKITVIKPDGSKLVIGQIVEFTRTATFDEVTGEVIYTDWKLAKSNAQGGKAQWDAYIPQAISGYTMHIEQKVGDKTTAINSIDAAEVTEATGDVTITVTYVAINPGGNGGNSDDTDHTIPEEPIKPDDHKPEVPVKTPNETSDDTEIDTTPKDQDLESGPAVIKGYEENNASLYEDMNNSAPARNNNSISPKGADTYASTNAPS